jgi:hypothetical protein
MRIAFIADYFYPQFMGGSELSNEALFSCAPESIIIDKIKSEEVRNIPEGYDLIIFGNIAKLPLPILTRFKHEKYLVIESDFKYCRQRSPSKCIALHGKCDCHRTYGRQWALFFYNAINVFYKSQAQLDIYTKHFPELKDNAIVLGATFSQEELATISSYRGMQKDNKYFVYNTDNWVKGTNETLQYCAQRRLPFRIIEDMPRDLFLKELAKSKGLAFLPNGLDTSPRLVLEAKILGCELILNDNVLIKDDPILKKSPDEVIEELKTRTVKFWEAVIEYFPVTA